MGSLPGRRLRLSQVSRWFLVILLVCLTPMAPSAATPQSAGAGPREGCGGTDLARFLTVPTWSIRATERFEFTADAGFTTNGVSSREQRTALQTVTVEGFVRRVERDEDSAEWIGEGTLTLVIQDRGSLDGRIKDIGSATYTTSGRANGRVRAEFWMAVDAERGKFEFQVRALEPIQVMETNEAGETTTRPREAVFLGVRELLPESAMLISGQSATSKPVSNLFGTASGHRNELTEWTLAPGPVDDLDCWIMPFPGYADWMPNPLGQGLAKEVPVQVEIQPKPGKKLDRSLCQLVFTMVDTSREPGLCLNKEAPEGLDAEFLPGAGITLSKQNQRAVLEVAKGKRQGEARVKLHDFGAWTRVKVLALFDDGTSREAEVKTWGGQAFQLPLDTNDNHIADAWEKEHGVMGLAATEDDEAVDGNANQGDGLSAYEEYRGLLLGGTHTRDMAPLNGRKPLSPKHKDLLVVDHTAGVAKPGYAYFQDLSKVTTIPVSPEDLPADALVNQHAQYAHLGDQHGVKVKSTAVAPDRTRPTWAGATVAKSGGKITESPGKTEEILIAPEFLRGQVEAQLAQAPAPYTFADQLKETVAHELGHAVGVPHHGDTHAGSATSFDYAVKEAATHPLNAQTLPGWSFFDWKVGVFDPKQLTRQPADEDIGKSPCESSGDIHCVMAYRQTPQWAQHYDERRDKYLFYHVQPFRIGDRFCTSAAGTEWNASGNALPSFFGDALEGRGNCFAKIRVKDF